MLKITSRAIKAELERRDIEVEVLAENPYSLLRYRYNNKWNLLASSLAELTTGVGKNICDQKQLAAVMADELNIPSPATVLYSDMSAAREFLEMHSTIVVKPSDASHGNGVTVGITTNDALERAITVAKVNSLDGDVLLQQQVYGNDIRMLVIGGVFAAAVKRTPAFVIGDGAHTVRELIDLENKNPNRGINYEKHLNIIDIDAAIRYLGEAINTYVPESGEQYTVVGTANIGTGGKATDYTDVVTLEMKTAAEIFAKTVKVAACGVDFMWDEGENTFHFIEANATPTFGFHLEPSEGKSRPVHKLFVDFILDQSDKIWQTKASSK